MRVWMAPPIFTPSRVAIKAEWCQSGALGNGGLVAYWCRATSARSHALTTTTISLGLHKNCQTKSTSSLTTLFWNRHFIIWVRVGKAVIFFRTLGRLTLQQEGPGWHCEGTAAPLTPNFTPIWSSCTPKASETSHIPYQSRLSAVTHTGASSA